MTTIDSYHSRMVSPISRPSHASQRLGVPGQSAPSDGTYSKSEYKRLVAEGVIVNEHFEVTPEEEAAWLEKLQRLAGCVV